MKISKLNGKYNIVIITDEDGNAEMLDASIEDWREYVDCATMDVHEFSITPK